MKRYTINLTQQRTLCVALAGSFMLAAMPGAMQASVTETNHVIMQNNMQITGIQQINPTTIEVLFTENRRMTFDFYGDNIFRLFQDNQGGIMRDPEAKPEAQILTDRPRQPLSESLQIDDNRERIHIRSAAVLLELNKTDGLMTARNPKTGAIIFEELEPVQYKKNKTLLTLKENEGEYFYGGGVQNGRFSHKGKAIAIENQNSWTDGGVASPTPYYWSTNGYGFMWYTFNKGKYDFGGAEKGKVILTHDTDYLDVFYMISDGAVPLLNDFYQLTGNPVLLPKFGFYQGHLNAYNRDYWAEDEKGILFEDGKRYKESQKENGGIKESLNGESDNYQFSARAVIDRYKKQDMPLGWLLPNDGYGAGYGQTETLDGNIENLKKLTDYAHQQGVEIGLWTQSDLHPKPEISALLQRDIVKEVRDAGVRVLKTDVAWVGAGYSFGLNGVADVAQIMPYYGNNSRPFIISLDGWAGTQRYAGIWSGDQTGGVWEYIRFHIPTYIGSGLSGQPNISSDMDGIFGGQNPFVNARDFAWKTFTPMELNMDGWGRNEKYPHALGEPATSINRWYLKMKSELMPYTYSLAKESVNGLPMVRALFLEYPNAYTFGKSTQYQFLYGPWFLVAPVYQETAMQENGDDIRNGIYLPEGEWIDYFTGDTYSGNCILNNFDAPLWKLPLFVKNGAIIPVTHPHNNPNEIDLSLRSYELYPDGETAFLEYDDDGKTEAYRAGEGVYTFIESRVDPKGKAIITLHPADGNFDGFIREKKTRFTVNTTERPRRLSARIGSKKLKLNEASTLKEFENGTNVWFYDAAPNLNRFATAGSDFEKTEVIKNPQIRVMLEPADITMAETVLEIEGFRFDKPVNNRIQRGALTAPVMHLPEENREAYLVTPEWDVIENADFYEIEFNDMLYTTIQNTHLTFDELEPETDYTFKIRAVNRDGVSDWSVMQTQTQANPLQFAIKSVTAKSSAAPQWGFGVDRLFDFAESGDGWHTKYGTEAVPFDVIIDLNSVNQLDKFEYLPREDGGNGTWLKGSVAYSQNKEDWTPAGSFEWERNGEHKTFCFEEHPAVRYIKLEISEAVGKYGSGRELYVFKVPGTESYLPGDINNDGVIDANDLTSYMNYTGLREGDADFGYISSGDINGNGLIDAYDISTVATRLNGGIEDFGPDSLLIGGMITAHLPKQQYKAGEVVELEIKGHDLAAVNAFSFALPYDQQDFEYAGIEPVHLKQMENLTYDRLHTNGRKSLYPTFVNLGDQETLDGNELLFIIRLKAKRDAKFIPLVTDIILVDKRLEVKK